MAKVKSINALMKYLRNKHNISINGTKQKRDLRNIGYYHGYKGYRFINTKINPLTVSDFNQISSIYKFDLDLKSLLYSHIMFVETALKNYTLEVVLDEAKTDDFNKIYSTILTNYKDKKLYSNPYKDAMKRRLDLRNKIYSALTIQYRYKKLLVEHYYHKDIPVPIWGIFEVISLGEFGTFVTCLSVDVKRKIGKELGLNSSFNPEGELIERSIQILQDLRNAIAHNDVVFDTRFRRRNPNPALIKMLESETSINNINFTTITDYLILIVYYLKKLGKTKTEQKQLINNYSKLTEQLSNEIELPDYIKLFTNEVQLKIELLTKYAQKQ